MLSPHARFGFGLLLAACALLGATVFSPSAWAREKSDRAPAGSAEAAKDLNVARKMIKAGNYSQAIPRLLKVLGEFSGTREAVDAHYYLGVAYDAIQDLRNAQLQLKQYLAQAPEGEYAADAAERLKQLGGALEEKFVAPAAVDQRLEAARQRAAAAPEEVGPQLEVADLLWQKEDFAGAGKIYAALLPKYPKLQDDMVLRQRMYRDDAGAWRVLDPETVIRQAADKDPLTIYNTTSFRSGRQEGYSRSFQAAKYNVTGQAMNRGSAALKDVDLIATIYGFGGKVFDTKTQRIGRLAPGESRPFSFVFENFDNIENVERYEVKGSFTR